MRKHLLGFTLIEILIVMLIISIVSGISIFMMSTNQDTRFETFSRQLVNKLTLVEEQAILQPAVLGVSFTKEGCQFYRYQHQWKTYTTPLRLPAGMELSLSMEGKQVTSTTAPQLIISTSGDITPFTLRIGKAGKEPRYEVVGDASGNIISRKYA